MRLLQRFRYILSRVYIVIDATKKMSLMAES